MTEKYAVIDLGSNSFRLEIGHFDGRKLVSDHYVKETVRLAAGFDSRGCLTEDTETRALASLARVGRLIRGIPLSRIRAVGTQALRIAKNSSDFLTRAEPVLGCPIHIIPGTEEARLTYLGCIKSLNPPTTDPILVIDIGGASTELSVGDGSRLCEATSFPIGCVNTTIASFSSRELNEQTIAKAIDRAAQVFEAEAARFTSHPWKSAYGSAGTISSLHSVAAACGWGSGPITPDIIRLASQALAKAGYIDQLNLPGLKPDRRDIIAGGFAVLAALFRVFRIQELNLATGSLRTGVFYDLSGL